MLPASLCLKAALRATHTALPGAKRAVDSLHPLPLSWHPTSVVEPHAPDTPGTEIDDGLDTVAARALTTGKGENYAYAGVCAEGDHEHGTGGIAATVTGPVYRASPDDVRHSVA